MVCSICGCVDSGVNPREDGELFCARCAYDANAMRSASRSKQGRKLVRSVGEVEPSAGPDTVDVPSHVIDLEDLDGPACGSGVVEEAANNG